MCEEVPQTTLTQQRVDQVLHKLGLVPGEKLILVFASTEAPVGIDNSLVNSDEYVELIPQIKKAVGDHSLCGGLASFTQTDVGNHMLNICSVYVDIQEDGSADAPFTQHIAGVAVIVGQGLQQQDIEYLKLNGLPLIQEFNVENTIRAMKRFSEYVANC